MSIQFTQDQAYAYSAFCKGKSIFLTGDAGTGKSMLVKEMIAKAQADGRRVAVTASTGIAASLLPGGRTIHSFLHAYPGMKLSNINYLEKIDRLADTDVLIIDEISILGDVFLPYLYNCLCAANKRIQLVVVGDFFQIPPINDAYAFQSPYWEKLKLTPCVLHEIVRQSDKEMIRNLNMLKFGDARCLPYFLSHSSAVPFDNQITICAKSDEAKRINQAVLSQIEGVARTYLAEYDDQRIKTDYPIDDQIEVKVGARVMAIVNSTEYVNGSLGTVTELCDDSIEVQFDNGVKAKIKRHTFDTGRYTAGGERITVRQFPLRLAHAITIHKAQGQTFEFVNIDGASCWERGQLYVAISRAKAVERIHFTRPITDRNIRTDKDVIDFYMKLEYSAVA